MSAAGLLGRRTTTGRPQVAEFPDTSPAGIRELRDWAQRIPDATERQLVLDRLDTVGVPEQVLTAHQQRVLDGEQLSAAGVPVGPDSVLDAVALAAGGQVRSRLREAVLAMAPGPARSELLASLRRGRADRDDASAPG